MKAIDNNKLDVSMGPTWILRVLYVYQRLWLSTYGRLPIIPNYGKVGKLLKPWTEHYSEYQLALMLMQYFEWYGMDGDDDFEHRRLHTKAFPLEWFHNYIDPIAAFLGDTLDDEEEVKRLVDSKLREINKLHKTNGI